MKFAKRTMSILLAMLLLASVLPLSVYAATLKITTQPKTSYTAYGSTAKATIKASGDGLKYTWYFKNAGASKFSKSSITSSTYSTKMSDTTKNRQVYCVVKDKKGKTVKSSTATLRMKATITTQPKTAYAQKDKTVSTVVKAKGDGLKYTWYIKNAGTSSFKKSSITQSTYSTKMADICKNRQVYCVVTDKWGKTAKSSTVTLRMAATITTEPKNMTAENGKKVTASLKAVGDGLKYQWYMKNAGASKFTKSSITKSTYTTTMSDTTKGRQIYCVVTDKYGKKDTSKTVTLSMKQQPLTITMQPESAIASVNDEVGFGIVVTGGTAPYTYQLKYALFPGNNEWKNMAAEKTTLGNMTILSVIVTPKMYSRKFCIEVTDSAGKKVTSNVVRIEECVAKTDLEITQQPQVAQAAVGDGVFFTVRVEGGTEPYTYCWQYIFDGRDDWDDFIVDGCDTDTIYLITESVDFSDHFRYRCVITDAEGNEIISEEAWIELPEGGPEITKQPVSATAAAGDTVGFGIIVTGGTAPYTYQLKYTHSGLLGWYNMNAEVLTMGSMTELAFVVTEQSLINQYQYCIVVTDATGAEVYSDVVWVEASVPDVEPLTIEWQTSPDLAVNVGEVVELAVFVVGGTQPYTYQWQYVTGGQDMWQDLPANDRDVLSVEVYNGYFEHGYLYRCVITDAQGEQVISDTMRLVEKLEPFIIATQPQNTTAKVGDRVSFSVVVEGGKEPYTYKWEYMSDDFEWTAITGNWATGFQSDTISFVVDMSEFRYNYCYRCKITDALGNLHYSDEVHVIWRGDA